MAKDYKEKTKKIVSKMEKMGEKYSDKTTYNRAKESYKENKERMFPKKKKSEPLRRRSNG